LKFHTAVYYTVSEASIPYKNVYASIPTLKFEVTGVSETNILE